MHILYLTPAYPPLPGGGERYVRSLAHHLALESITLSVITSHARTERELWAGTAQQHSEPVRDGSIMVMRLPTRPFPGGRLGLHAWRKLMVVLSALPLNLVTILQFMARRIPPLANLRQTLQQLETPDLIHGFNISWESPLLAGRRYAQRHQIPFVATPYMHFGAGRDRVARNTTMQHQQELLRAADRLLVLTRIERQGLLALGCAPERVIVIGGGLDPPPPLAETAVLQQKYHLPSPYVLIIGRANYDKGAIHAAKATLALREEGFSLILGQIGQRSSDFERFYRRLTPPQQQGIRPLGILSEQEKHTLLAGAAALLLPSRTDSFGIVLLEAWAHGAPVIAARAGGIPGVVDEGENGLLVPFGDVPALAAALRRLLADPLLAKRLGENGRAKVNDVYTWPTVAHRVLAQYRQLLAPDA